MPSYFQLVMMGNLVSRYVEQSIGGKLYYIDSKEENLAIFRLEKIDQETNEKSHLDYKISYEELEKIVDPLVLAQNIIDAYKKSEKNG